MKVSKPFKKKRFVIAKGLLPFMWTKKFKRLTFKNCRYWTEKKNLKFHVLRKLLVSFFIYSDYPKGKFFDNIFFLETEARSTDKKQCSGIKLSRKKAQIQCIFNWLDVTVKITRSIRNNKYLWIFIFLLSWKRVCLDDIGFMAASFVLLMKENLSVDKEIFRLWETIIIYYFLMASTLSSPFENLAVFITDFCPDSDL